MDKLKIYIAGPHVFWSDTDREELYVKIEEMENKYNFTALVPKDGDVSVVEGESLSLNIWLKNINHMKSCGIIVADITPFRGVSLDAGTAYEIGFCAAMDKTVSMWSHAAHTTYKERATNYEKEILCDYYGFPWLNCSKEDFGLTENLMIQPFEEVQIHASIEQAVIDGIKRHKEWEALND